MRAWRIAKRTYANDLSGIGSAIAGGRWNSIGVNAIYLGGSIELCILEKLAHIGAIMPNDLVLAEFTLPDDAALYSHPSHRDLPKGWDDLPASEASARFGDAFLIQGNYLGIFLPSVIVPESNNLLLNPRHPAMQQVSVHIVRDFRFDTRLR